MHLRHLLIGAAMILLSLLFVQTLSGVLENFATRQQPDSGDYTPPPNPRPSAQPPLPTTYLHAPRPGTSP